MSGIFYLPFTNAHILYWMNVYYICKAAICETKATISGIRGAISGTKAAISSKSTSVFHLAFL